MEKNKKHRKLKECLIKAVFIIMEELALLIFAMALFSAAIVETVLYLHYGDVRVLIWGVIFYIIMLHIFKKFILSDIWGLHQIPYPLCTQNQKDKEVSDFRIDS